MGKIVIKKKDYPVLEIKVLYKKYYCKHPKNANNIKE